MTKCSTLCGAGVTGRKSAGTTDSTTIAKSNNQAATRNRRLITPKISAAAGRSLKSIPMRLAGWLGLIIITMINIPTPVHAQADDEALRIYAVNVVKTPPFQKPFTGYGVYLGQGLVLTAAHVVGHWPFFTHPRVLVAGQDLPVTIIKQGSSETTDLALLSVDAERLPVSLRLRRNPICKIPPTVGMEVVDVEPQATTRAHIISPFLILPSLQRRFDSLIDSPKASGSAIFDPERKCLLGIVSAKVEKYAYGMWKGRIVWAPSGYAGYFVSAAKIINFIPQDIRY
jgi:hypothetical protein